MHPVGDVPDRDLLSRPAREERLKEPAAHLAVQTAHAVDRSARPDGQEGHVERLSIRIGPESEDPVHIGPQLLDVFAEVLPDEAQGEPIEARLDGGVGGEQVAGSRRAQRFFEPDSVVFHVAPRPLEDGKGGVALVQMADLRLDAERSQYPPAADAEDELLLQPHLRATTVELAGDASVDGAVQEVVRVEQV